MLQELHSSHYSSFTLNQGWVYHECVPINAVGQTTLDYYSKRYCHSGRDAWLQHILKGRIRINGQIATANSLLQAGQKLEYHRPPWYEPNVPLNFSILYEDETLWAINKPAGLPVLPGGGFLEHTLLHQLQYHYPADTPIPVHRLGRGTSGVMLVARTPQTRAHLSQQLRNHTMGKIYRALVASGNMPDQFMINQPIGKLPHPILGYVYGATDTGKPAYTQCRVLQRHRYHARTDNQSATLLEATILTGRPHQIRIHLAFYGYPLLGDPLYDAGGGLKIPGNGSGQTDPLDFKPQNHEQRIKGIEAEQHASHQRPIPVPGDCGYWLHAHRLSFTNPLTGQRQQITCPPPELLQTAAE